MVSLIPVNHLVKRYYVIQFMDQKPDGIIHMCVPLSWITRVHKEWIVQVAYPNEALERTINRIHQKETIDKSWNTFFAAVLYGFDTFKDGIRWMLEKNFMHAKHFLGPIKKGQPSTSRTKDVPTRNDDLANLSIQALAQRIVSDNLQKLQNIPIENTPKQPTKAEKSCKNLQRSNMLPVDFNNENPQPISEQTCLAPQNPKPTKRRLESCTVDTDNCSQYKATPSSEPSVSLSLLPVTVESIYENIVVVDSNVAANGKQNQEVPNTAEHSELSNKIKEMTEKLNDSYERLNAATKEFDAVKDYIMNSIVVFNDVVKKGIEAINDVCNTKIQEIKEFSSTSNNMTNTQTEGTIEILDSDDDGDDNNNTFSDDADKHSKNEEVPKKKIKLEKQFVLPLDYTPGNSNWTLKHKKASKGLVEIIPKSKIYIDKIKFVYYKEISKDCNMLARKLMEEIFKESALKVCSLPYKVNKTNPKPVLDKTAVSEILRFIKMHAKNNDWDFNQHLIEKNMSKRLHNLHKLQDKDISIKHTST